MLVVDGGGSKRCALLGDNIAAMAVKHGWSGIIINGCIRDSQDIGEMDLGVKVGGAGLGWTWGNVATARGRAAFGGRTVGWWWAGA